MYFKRRAFPEAFPTLAALIGLGSCVDPQVGTKGRAVPECFSALLALVGSLPAVDPQVHVESRAPAEAVPALHADVGPFLSVRGLVLGQSGAVAAPPATLGALVGVGQEAAMVHGQGLPPVDSAMSGECRTLAKALPAHGALVGLLARVCSHVGHQRGALPEGFPALCALVRFLSRVDPLMPNDG